MVLKEVVKARRGKKLKIKTHSGLNNHEIMENGTTYATFARAFFESNFNQEKMLLNFFVRNLRIFIIS